MPSSRPLLVLLALVLTVALAACSPTDTGPSGGVAPAEALPPAFDDGVPAPSGEVVLTLEVDDDVVDWDLATLGQLPQHDLTVLEPFLKTEHTFSGPAWGDVLQASGVDLAAAPTMELVALDDYVSEVPTDAATLQGLLLATAQDGEAIPLAEGGPIRLVFDDGNQTGANRNLWIWSLRSGRQL